MIEESGYKLEETLSLPSPSPNLRAREKEIEDDFAAFMRGLGV